MGVTVAAVIALSACDSAPAHPSEPTLVAALQAVQYGDASGFTRLHVESTDGSVYCTEKPMQRLWERAGDVAEADRCANLEAVTGDELEEAPDQLRFLLQVVRFRCESPVATCRDYGARALQDGLTASTLWSARPTGWTLRKFIGDDDNAVAYVDIETAGQTLHRAVRMTRQDGEWRVRSGLLEGGEP